MSSAALKSSIEKLRWEKLGFLFNPASLDEKLSFAQVPFTSVQGECLRIYFSTRPPKSINGLYEAQVRWIEISIPHLPFGKVIRTSEGPVLGSGRTGAFDDHGVMGGSLEIIDGETVMYYSGWSLGGKVPYLWGIGIAKMDEGGDSFSRVYEGPVVGSCRNEPFLQASPIVFRHGSSLRMFYLSGYGWELSNNRFESLYHLCYAESSDGISWERSGKPIVEKISEDECQTSPTIIELESGYAMYFSYRRGLNFRNSQENSYRIGVAISQDLETWTRIEDPEELVPTPSSWDSNMVCYPHIFSAGGQIYMLYCGDDFGKEGFGLARLGKGAHLVRRVVA